MSSLRLTPFEHYFLINDRDSCPSEFFVWLQLGNHLDIERCRAALDATQAAHPLVRARIRRRQGHGPWWVPCEKRLKQIEHDQPLDRPLNLPRIKIDQEPGIRLHHYQSPGSTESASEDPSAGESQLLFQVHHCVMDGLGFFQFLDDWMSAYRGDAPPATATLSPLRRRCRPNVGLGESFRLLPGQWKSLRAAIRILGRKVIPVAEDRDDATAAPRPLAYLKGHLTEEETNRLSIAAAAKKATTSHILIRDLFRTLGDWSKQEGPPVVGTHHRIMVPFNERDRSVADLSACNHCTIVNVDRSPAEVGEEAPLLASVRDEMQVIQRWRLSLNFWRAMKVYSLLPGGLERGAATANVTTSALFTNLGNLSRRLAHEATEREASDRIVINDVAIIPTLNEAMATSLAIHFFDQRLGITLHYDTRKLTEPQAQRFLDVYLQHLRNSANGYH